MEELIGLLLAAAVLIFKYVGKRLDQSGSSAKARKVREFAEALDGEDSPMHDWEYLGKALLGEDDKVQEPISEPEAVTVPEPEAEPLPEVRPKALKSGSSVPNEDVQQKKNERIDPRKLVVYSEIMKPKFNE